ncbi:DUF5634 family protein [Bacillus alkalicellulosilyticus]|uniref:DUF5634 family protein n=1 Tax=Alkalihalobacterium alkalicellulosilyticum TaxID=1912214 RepID=UPI0009979599|nr:DUF5634 family protein [Bacillus alkalicellulosilyticus]
MTYESREAIIGSMSNKLDMILNTYELEEIGIFEEQGEGNEYYIGYTLRKDDEMYMIHTPYEKNGEGLLQPKKQEWTIELNDSEIHGISSFEEAMKKLESGFEH